jgi:hypothetical protein
MKKYNQIEVILFSKYYLKDMEQKELLRWLEKIVEPSIVRQEDRTEKLFLATLKNTFPIYLS